MLPPPSKFLYGCGRTTHPVGGEPDSAGRVPERDADGVAAARRAVVSHIELQGIVAGHGERRHRVGNVLDAGHSGDGNQASAVPILETAQSLPNAAEIQAVERRQRVQESADLKIF